MPTGTDKTSRSRQIGRALVSDRVCRLRLGSGGRAGSLITRGGFEELVVGYDVINAGSAVRSEAALRDRREEFAPPEGANPFGAPPDPDTSQIPYGQSAAFIDAVRPAAEVVRAISNEAELILNSRPRSLLS
jgi:hypothetical protein